MIWPEPVSPLSPSSFLASPKSVTRGLPSLVEQDVGRLQVAVDHAALVGVFDRLGDLRHQLGRLAGRQRAVGQPLREALPFDETHGEIMLPLVLADLVDRHDPGMIEIGGRLGLGVEAADVGLVGELAGEDHLERDGPVEADLPGLEDDAHAAAGELADDLVVAEIADARGAAGSVRADAHDPGSPWPRRAGPPWPTRGPMTAVWSVFGMRRYDPRRNRRLELRQRWKGAWLPRPHSNAADAKPAVEGLEAQPSMRAGPPP